MWKPWSFLSNITLIWGEQNSLTKWLTWSIPSTTTHVKTIEIFTTHRQHNSASFTPSFPNLQLKHLREKKNKYAHITTLAFAVYYRANMGVQSPPPGWTWRSWGMFMGGSVHLSRLRWGQKTETQSYIHKMRNVLSDLFLRCRGAPDMVVHVMASCQISHPAGSIVNSRRRVVCVSAQGTINFFRGESLI